MFEVRLHGRGGQGTVLAAGILAKALVAEGKHVVAVPQFGFERRGAPVAAYLRASETPMRAMTNIYAPDCVVCIDSSLPRVVDIFAGLRAGGTLVQASRLAPQDIVVPVSVATVAVCDAVGIAREVFGRPITNTVMLGAFARATGLVSLDALERALEETSFRDGGLAQNRRALALGHARTVVHRVERREAA
ncbi:ketoisovalerate oxidoreductase [Aromatoleum toluvorans]|uniref:Ketoisovalerate oxidoreductase n=1 Tax=Aromatoleum toluvorans TaxID=92002 RepID=A0ABX1Q0C4_9RHOO|nr:2-oxoacid:acceptor oxidoreductase family protein [Aromatoleum toluvorans]NMG43806.1 ketoisovalerate oxidoreductase [Aromatoleum toluvorans]